MTFIYNIYDLLQILLKSSSDSNNIVVYEFHRSLKDPTELQYRTIESFRERSEPFYNLIATIGGNIDDYPSDIDIAIKINNEWYIGIDISSNYYLGAGPSSLIDIRQNCSIRKIEIIKHIISIKEWIINNFQGITMPESYKYIDFGFSEKTKTSKKKGYEIEFNKIIKDFSTLKYEIQDSSKKYISLEEPEIRNEMVSSLRLKWGRNKIFKESFIGKGKTDISITTKNGFQEFIFELKKRTKITSFAEAKKQLFKRYINSYNNYCGVIMFSSLKNYTNATIKLKNEIELEKGEIIEIMTRNPEDEYIVMFTHPKDRGRKITVYVSMININA